MTAVVAAGTAAVPGASVPQLPSYAVGVGVSEVVTMLSTADCELVEVSADDVLLDDGRDCEVEAERDGTAAIDATSSVDVEAEMVSREVNEKAEEEEKEE